MKTTVIIYKKRHELASYFSYKDVYDLPVGCDFSFQLGDNLYHVRHYNSYYRELLIKELVKDLSSLTFDSVLFLEGDYPSEIINFLFDKLHAGA